MDAVRINFDNGETMLITHESKESDIAAAIITSCDESKREVVMALCLMLNYKHKKEMNDLLTSKS